MISRWRNGILLASRQSLAQAEPFAVVVMICIDFELSVEVEATYHGLYFLTPKSNGARLRARTRCDKGLTLWVLES